MAIWVWINTYQYHFQWDEHPFTSYFDVHQGYKVLTHCYFSKGHDLRGSAFSGKRFWCNKFKGSLCRLEANGTDLSPAGGFNYLSFSRGDEPN